MADSSPSAVADQARIGTVAPVAVGSERSDTLAAALGRFTTLLEERADGQWRFQLPGMRRSAWAILSVEWLSISVSLRVLRQPMDVRRVSAMLSRNARIDGTPRIIGCREPRERQLVVDIPTDGLPWQSEPEIERLLAAAIASLSATLNAKPPHVSMPRQAQLPRERLEGMFDEAGWPTRYGVDEGLQVPLDVPRNYVAAKVAHDSNWTRLRVPVLANQSAPVSDACRGAVAVLVWLVARGIRMVKPTRTRRALALEVTLPTAAVNEVNLAHGCAALSVALQQLFDEAELLAANELLAQTYLSNLGYETAA